MKRLNRVFQPTTHARRWLWVAAAILLLTAGCKPQDNRPPNILDEDRYVALLTDLFLAEGYFAIESGYSYRTMDTALAGCYDTLLALHGVTLGQLDSTATYYIQHRESNQRIYDRVLENLNATVPTE